MRSELWSGNKNRAIDQTTIQNQTFKLLLQTSVENYTNGLCILKKRILRRWRYRGHHFEILAWYSKPLRPDVATDLLMEASRGCGSGTICSISFGSKSAPRLPSVRSHGGFGPPPQVSAPTTHIVRLGFRRFHVWLVVIETSLQKGTMIRITRVLPDLSIQFQNLRWPFWRLSKTYP